ncbi:magnesium transporter [Synoicihabitans lomoniglobus]|uniref:Magnesium transporter MgtE n=1 Tax=Synoicihabitans lomoniglobus TaxID=2909285 RepID=A0AAE9ZY72_9BACT|nr:magnesium transporter [Opitutaceae bacterium LMO-M01]WED65369.1 magnesium transporter [Opitutaceae bacterium LMO-M01]
MTEPDEMIDRLEELIDARDASGASALLEALPAVEQSRFIDRLDDDTQEDLMMLVTPEQAASLLEKMPEAQAEDILDGLAPERAADIMEELDSDAVADLLGTLEDDEAEAILHEMEPEEAADARELLAYDEDTAGGLMRSEFLAYPLDATVGSVTEDMRSNAETYTDYDVQYAYIVDADERPVGVLRLRDLLLSTPATPVTKIMLPRPLVVHHAMELDELAQLFDDKGFVGLPVVDDEKKLVGVVMRKSVREAAADDVAEDFLKVSGLGGREELRSMPLVVRSRRRLSWLSINILLNVLAASVIAAYQDTLAQVIALAVFLPIISDMSGCSGSQAVAVSIRELALGLVRPVEMMRVLGKEMALGCINGLALGALLAVVALLWKGNPWLGAVVGGALMVNTIVAVSLGGLIPLALKRFDFDPALASGPILTTVTDMCGFFFVLSLATMLLPHLV